MALDKLTKIEVTAYAGVIDNLLEELQNLSVLQIDPHSIEEWESEKDYIEKTEESIVSLRAILQRVNRVLNFLEPYSPPIPFVQKFGGGLPEIDKSGLIEEAKRKKADSIIEESLGLESRLSEIKAQIKDLSQKTEELKPFLNLKIPLKDLKLKNTEVIISKIEKERYEDLVESIDSNLIYIERISGEDLIYFLLVYHLSVKLEVEDLLKNFRIESIILPSVEKTAEELINGYHDEIERLLSEEGEILSRVKDIAQNIDVLRYYFDYINTEIEKEEVKKRFFYTKKTFVINGWIKERDYPELEALINRYREVSVQKIEKKKDEVPPVAYKNNKLVSPFELIVNLYSPPNPNEIDPTPILMPFYAVFFGICLTEAGYGFVIMLLTALALLILKPRGGNRKFITLFLILGFFTLVIGSLIGTVFGINFDNLPQNLAWLRKARYKIMIFDSSKDVLTFFALSLALGVIHLIAGYLIKIYMLIKDGDWAEAVCDHLPWIFLLLSPVPKVLAKAMPDQKALLDVVFYILIGLWAGILLFFSERSTLNPLKRIGKGLFTLYGVSSVLADVLSYSRLLALGLATGVIAGVMNTLAKMVKQIPVIGIIGFFLVLVGGHMFNLLISGLGAFVHSIRLQFMEFFTKFYTGEGVLFEPFTERRKYTFKPVENRGKK